MKIKYEVLSNLDHDNKLYGRGDSVALEDEHAAPLLAAGVIVAAPPAPEGEDAAAKGKAKK
jgi:hypothetical protein